MRIVISAHLTLCACCEFHGVTRLLCCPQLVDARSLQLALHFAKAADNPYFRIGYNSLGAYGTINHLHFQVSSTVLRSYSWCVLTVTAISMGSDG